ncbi:hypothetical protein GUJ93_ZPchr0012g21845 [Zizania palustris]|uniref:Uncharacterized protein n=1 Tax=Zizania palustris TaxID=103762 RepID=A0A8J5WUU1_ZIZPA|nr:hypothetical protein GUJ93_ZPchr0012g21845 [Zizania palustris]
MPALQKNHRHAIPRLCSTRYHLVLQAVCSASQHSATTGFCHNSAASLAQQSRVLQHSPASASTRTQKTGVGAEIKAAERIAAQRKISVEKKGNKL